MRKGRDQKRRQKEEGKKSGEGGQGAALRRSGQYRNRHRLRSSGARVGEWVGPVGLSELEQRPFIKDPRGGGSGLVGLS